MKIYKSEPRFDPRTGEPTHPEKSWKETRCDFTGAVVESRDPKLYPAYYCQFVLDYGSQDPCFGASGEEFEFGEKYDINMFNFLSDSYVILDDMAETGETAMPKFLKHLSKCESLDGALREMRIKTAKRLIKAGIIKPEDLIG